MNPNQDFAVTLHGLDEAIKLLFATAAGSEKVMARTMHRIGTLNRDAIRQKYAPRSPTIADLKKSGVKGKQGRNTKGQFTAKKIHRRVHPGGLERSIEVDTSAANAAIFVAANSEAGAYAFMIHNLKGVEWQNRGVGTISKGPKADDDFIPRGIVDHSKQSFAILVDEQTKAWKAA